MQAVFLRVEEAAAEQRDNRILRSASKGACTERTQRPASGSSTPEWPKPAGGARIRCRTGAGIAGVLFRILSPASIRPPTWQFPQGEPAKGCTPWCHHKHTVVTPQDTMECPEGSAQGKLPVRRLRSLLPALARSKGSTVQVVHRIPLVDCRGWVYEI
jgi:hypothetical protein